MRLSVVGRRFHLFVVLTTFALVLQLAASLRVAWTLCALRLSLRGGPSVHRRLGHPRRQYVVWVGFSNRCHQTCSVGARSNPGRSLEKQAARVHRAVLQLWLRAGRTIRGIWSYMTSYVSPCRRHESR
jgi:hypothetical protein